MTERVQYTYITLRYVHDITTQEFVNVGVILYAPASRFVGARCLTYSSRLAKMFPELDTAHFASLLSHVQAQIDIINSSLHGAGRTTKTKTLKEIVTSVLSKDDSALQWDEAGSGVTDNPRATLTSLFERLVAKYEEPTFQFQNQAPVLAMVQKELSETKMRLSELAASTRRVDSNFGLILTILNQILARVQYDVGGSSVRYFPATSSGLNVARFHGKEGNLVTYQNSGFLGTNVEPDLYLSSFSLGERSHGNR